MFAKADGCSSRRRTRRLAPSIPFSPMMAARFRHSSRTTADVAPPGNWTCRRQQEENAESSAKWIGSSCCPLFPVTSQAANLLGSKRECLQHLEAVSVDPGKESRVQTQPAAPQTGSNPSNAPEFCPAPAFPILLPAQNRLLRRMQWPGHQERRQIPEPARRPALLRQPLWVRRETPRAVRSRETRQASSANQRFPETAAPSPRGRAWRLAGSRHEPRPARARQAAGRIRNPARGLGRTRQSLQHNPDALRIPGPESDREAAVWNRAAKQARRKRVPPAANP